MHVNLRPPVESMTFPELDLLREQLRLSQAKLCQRCDLNPGTYMRWRRWARGEPKGARPTSRSLRSVREALKSELAEVERLVAAE